ncbi:nuclear transport factor 2 family protein [Pseudarthrobacter sp. NPDC058329]|uniref:nuclear transport factor 2 family protein n=1 Tax=Pseudarthrobacter sp. NPDC058329 TaxID=3346448 RepID=UPI0036DC8242
MRTPTLQNLADQQALLDLGIRFAMSADHEETTKPTAALFAENGIFEVNGQKNTGRKAIEDFLQKMRANGFAGPGVGTRHLICNARVVFDEHGGAQGSSEWLLLSPEQAGQKASILASGRYLDSYEKMNGEWVFSHRKVS